MTRMDALEAVAEAAREITRWPDGLVDGGAIVDRDAVAALWRALDALDALPATPGEMVEFSAWEHEDGMIAWYRAGSRHDLIEMSGWTRLGTVRLPLVKETRDAG